MAEEVTISNLLANEIGSQLDYLQKLTPGKEEHSSACKDIATLYKVFNDECETSNRYFEAETRKSIEEAKIELEKKKMELEERKIELEEKKLDFDMQTAVETERKERFWKKFEFGLEIADIVVKIFSIAKPLKDYRDMFHEGLQFEETGSVSSKFFGSYLNKRKPNGI